MLGLASSLHQQVGQAPRPEHKPPPNPNATVLDEAERLPSSLLGLQPDNGRQTRSHDANVVEIQRARPMLQRTDGLILRNWPRKLQQLSAPGQLGSNDAARSEQILCQAREDGFLWCTC